MGDITETTEQQQGQQSQQDSQTDDVLDELIGSTEQPEHEPPPDHPRFKQIYGKMKELERNMGALQEELSKRDMLIEEMRAHNERLAHVIERATQPNQPDMTTAIQSRLSQIKKEKEAALADGDLVAYDRLNEEQLELKMKLKDMELSTKLESRKIPPEVQHFIDSNKWFVENAAMRGAAVAIEQELNLDPMWANKPIAVKLAEVARRVKDAFGIKDNKPAAGADMGTGSRQQGRSAGLTAEQRAVARALGLTDEQYLRQLKLMEKEV